MQERNKKQADLFPLAYPKKCYHGGESFPGLELKAKFFTAYPG